MLRNIFLTFLFLFVYNFSFAQAQKVVVTGTVTTADGKPAEYINVNLKNTNYGALTDGTGNFKFEAPAGNYIMYVFSITSHRKEFPITIKPDTINCFPHLTIIETAKELGEVVITGTRTEKRLSESPVLTTLISAQDIRKAGSTSTLETLQDNIPGIVITPNAMGNNMRIRGLNSRYILFLVDGERLVSEGAGGNINFDQLNISNIKRIEMVNGAASALYGSNAMGAVINVITQDPIHSIEVGANQSFENYNTWRSKIDVGSSLEKFATRASAFRNSSDGFGGTGDGAYAARYVDYGGDLKLKYKPTAKSDINVIGRYFHHETFNPEESMNVKHPQTQNLTVGVNGGFTSPNDKNTLRLSANYDKYFNYDILEKKNNEQKLTSTASYLSARALNTYTLSTKWEFVGGLEYNHEENYAITTLGSDPTTKAIDDINAFGQAEYKILSNLDVIGGARYTYNSQFGSAFTPKLSAMYEIEGFKFRGGIGTAFRAPSIKELYYDFDHQGMFWVHGNPDLQAERGIYSSLSAEYSIGDFDASVSGYYNFIDNKITQYIIVDAQGKDNRYYKNVSSATLQGVDVSAAYTLFEELVLKGNYSFCNAIDNATGLQLVDNVKHSGTASITWNGKIFKSPFSLQFAGRLNSPILYQYVETQEDGSEKIIDESSKPYSIWKIVLVKPFYIKTKHVLELTFKIDNLFNFKAKSFVDPGRQYLLGVRYSFKSQKLK